ncbi:MAG: hypothetical protein GY711_25050 [bacterium]|nr:hypothetical protein [bacterium]
MDYDADGDLDILSGSYTGEVYLFERGAAGELAQGRYLLNAEGDALKTGTSVTPEAIDMDADGDLDLVIGTRTDGVYVFENVGTRAEPSWSAESRTLKTVDGKKIEGSNAHHADWDGDGVRDLVVGSEWGGADWHRNVGTNDVPSYAAAVTLVGRHEYEERSEAEGPASPGSRTKVFVTDWNGDGEADLLLGDVQWLYKTLPPLTAEQEAEKVALEPILEEANAVLSEAVKERFAYAKEPTGVPEDVEAAYQAALDAYTPHARKMASFDRRKSSAHGWVWLYLREADVDDEPTAPCATSVPREFGPTRLRAAAFRVEGAPTRRRVEATLKLRDGWHVYADTPDGAPYPATEPALSLPEGGRVVTGWSTRTAAHPATDDSGANWFVGEVTFTCEVEVAEPTDPLEVSMEFQVCDDQVCLPPKTLTVELALAAPAEDTEVRFAAPTRIMAGEEYLGEGRLYPSPALHDVNGDEHLDMVVGDLMGRVTVALGDARPMRFAQEKPLLDRDETRLKFNNW